MVTGRTQIAFFSQSSAVLHSPFSGPSGLSSSHREESIFILTHHQRMFSPKKSGIIYSAIFLACLSGSMETVGFSLKYRNSIDEFFIKYCRFWFQKRNNKDLLCAYCFVVFRKETESHSVGQEKPLALASPVMAGTGGMGRLVGVSFHFRMFCM